MVGSFVVVTVDVCDVILGDIECDVGCVVNCDVSLDVVVCAFVVSFLVVGVGTVRALTQAVTT